MNRATPLMYQTVQRSAHPTDGWAAAHLKLVAILTREHSPPPARYTAARDFCRAQAAASPADAYDWEKEAEHWQAQLERVQPDAPVASDEEVPF